MCFPNNNECEDKSKWVYDGHEAVLRKGIELIKREGIDLIESKICHNGIPCTFKFNEYKITIGCHTITPDALKFILSKWDAKFLGGPKDFTIQP